MKIVTILIVVFIFVVLSVPVIAETSATSSTVSRDIKKVEKLQTKENELKESIENRINKLERNKQGIVRRIRNSVIVRFNVYEKHIEKSGLLLTKLQERIDKAQKSGFNTTTVDGYMSDAKAKLEDAKSNLESIKSLKDEAIDKKTFQDIQKKFIVIHKDLNAIRLDGAKIIAELKKYNSQSPKLTPKPTRTATTSATQDR